MSSLSPIDIVQWPQSPITERRIIGYETVTDNSYFAVGESVLPIFADRCMTANEISNVINTIHDGSLAAQSSYKTQQVDRILKPEGS